MFFRNLTLFRFPPAALAGWFQSREVHSGASFHLEPPAAWDALAACAMKPVGPLELSSRGFISPFGRGEEALSHRCGDYVWLTVGGEDKIIPGSVVNDLLAKKLEEIERKEGRKPGGRTRKRIKEDLLHELLPKAFVKPSRIDGLLDLQHGFIAVDTASRKSGENVVSEVRRALGSFPALPLNAELSPRAILTGWVAGEPLPEGLTLGEECELKDAMDGGAVIKCQQQEMQSDEIAKHLEAGKQVTRLALTLDDHVSFVLGEDLVIRKLKFLDGAIDQLENTEREDLRAELDARFALMSGEVSRLFAVLESALKLAKSEG
jgi:recombination associated protein RdgC